MIKGCLMTIEVPVWHWSTILKDSVSQEWKYLISWAKDMGYSPGINKGSKVIKQYKKLIKNWVAQTCPCRLCKSAVPGVGF